MENPLYTRRDVSDPQELAKVWDEIKEYYQGMGDFGTDWDSIKWAETCKRVSSLRSRIYVKTKQATISQLPSDWEKVRLLQRRMIGSFDNALVSVRRVTQVNKGKYTPGLDNFLVKTKEHRFALVLLVHQRINIYNWSPQPVSRRYIPKPNGKLRPLGIPTIVDRVIQAIVKNALEPQSEYSADIGSYGFRPGKSAHDAIEKLHKTLTTRDFTLPRKNWILDADIEGCFDNIDHGYLLEMLNDFPATPLIERWLKAGYVDKEVFHETDTGTPQGGIISPLLANLALDGLEKEIGVKYRLRKSSTSISGQRWVLDDYIKKDAPHPPRAFVRYADDFVVLCETESDCHNAKSTLEGVLLRRGLKFSSEKISIRNVVEGFDFLGITVRSFESNINVHGKSGTKIRGFKLIISPSFKSQSKYRAKLKDLFVSCHGKSVDHLIRKVNPVIRGWANYHRKFSSRKVFEKMDLYLFVLQKRFGLRTHPNKSKGWIIGSYFGALSPSHPMDNWVFGNIKTKYHMVKHRWVGISRHDMVPNNFSPDDPSLRTFWEKRSMLGKNSSLVAHSSFKLAQKAKHLCLSCLLSLYNHEALEIHHIVPKRLGGPDTQANKVILHKICHQSLRTTDHEASTKDRLLGNLRLIQRKGFRSFQPSAVQDATE